MGVCYSKQNVLPVPPLHTDSMIFNHNSQKSKESDSMILTTNDVSDHSEEIPIYFTKQEWLTLSKIQKIRNLYDSRHEIEDILLKSFHFNHFDVNLMLTFYEVMADICDIDHGHSSIYDLEIVCEIIGRARMKHQQQVTFTNIVIIGYIREISKLLHTKYDNTQYQTFANIPPIHHIITSFYPLLKHFLENRKRKHGKPMLFEQKYNNEIVDAEHEGYNGPQVEYNVENENHVRIESIAAIAPASAEMNESDIRIDKIEQIEYESVKKWVFKAVAVPQDYKQNYYDKFIENGFDNFVVIKYMDDQDLMDIGVDKLEHRETLLIAAQKLVEDKLNGKYYTEIVSIEKCPQNLYNSTKDIENILYRMNLSTFDVACGIMFYQIMNETFVVTNNDMYDLKLIADVIVRLRVKIYPNTGNGEITTE